MKSPRTAPRASRAVRASVLISLLALLSALLPALAAPLSLTGGGGTGQALALLSALHNAHNASAQPAASAQPTPAALANESPSGYVNAPNGRAIMDRRFLEPGPISAGSRFAGPLHSNFRRKNGTGRVTGNNGSVVAIPGPVQTFDVNNPPPAFRPLVGFGTTASPPTSVNNDPTNPPIFLSSLTPTNLTPVWSQDQTFIVFSSNRTLLGAVAPDGRFHLWAISVNGGEAFQITTSTGPAGGGEFFPDLSTNGRGLVFTSDAQSPNVQNLYETGFDFSTLAGQLNAPTSIENVSDPTVIKSMTLVKGVDALGNPRTGFDQVQRPTFAPGNSGDGTSGDALVVFSAHSVTGHNAGHYHIYFLSLTTGGFDPGDLTSLPAKITDGPADDTDPAFSKDGQFVAFASTAGGFTNQSNGNNRFSPDPDTSQILSSNPSPLGLRNLFLVGGGGGNSVSGAGFGILPSSLQPTGGLITSKTAADQTGAVLATDNFGPAWSSITFNQYTNQSPGFEYLAFGRGFAPANYNPGTSAPLTHDVYYLQTVRNINAGGQGDRSNEAGTTPEPISTPIYQVDAGGFGFLGATGTGTNNLGFGNYQTDTGYTLINLPNSPPLVLAFGGVAGVGISGPLNQTNDPGTPSGIYSSDRTGPMTYILPNLTPGANYTVRFHLSDPTAAPGLGPFPIIVNGATTTVNIFQQAQSSQGQIGGLVTDSNGNVAQATITVSTFTPNGPGNQIAQFTTGAGGTAPDGAADNYLGSAASGTVYVTATAPNHDAVSQVVNVSAAAFSRADFNLGLSNTNGTVTGTVTDTGGNPQLNVPVFVTTTAASNGTTHNAGQDPASFLITPGVVRTDGNGSFTTMLPAGTYNVTVSGTGNGLTTQTQQVTVAANGTATPTFALAPASASGSLGGLVSANTIAQPGALITVLRGGAPAAIFQSSGTATSPAAPPPLPGGDGKPLNYDGLLTPGNYSARVQSYGFLTVTGNPAITVGAFTRVDGVLMGGTAAAGQNTAIVVTVPTQATGQFGGTQTVTTPLGTQQVKPGAIVIQFPNANSIVQGIEVLSDGNAQDSSGFGGFTAATTNTGPQFLTAIGGDGLVTLTFGLPANGLAPDSFNVFRSPVTAASVTSVNQPGAGAGSEGTNPFFNFPYVPGQNTVTFTDTNVTDGTEYFYQVTAVSSERITAEGAAISTTGGSVANAAIRLNTDDNAGETGQANAGGNSFDDVYPTWSPFLSIFSIAYQSGGYATPGGYVNVGTGVVHNGRTVTYNDPTANIPVEVAASIPNNGTANGTNNSGGYTVGGGYSGILESQVLNLDPPVLLRFSNNELVHVQPVGSGDPVNGVPTKTGINPGQPVTFTVRLSDREAGINNGTNNGDSSALFPTGPHTNAARPQVFLQIKDPESKYQNAAGLEHKVFARDDLFTGQSNQPATEFDSGSPNFFLPIDDSDGTPSSMYPTPPSFTRINCALYVNDLGAGPFFPIRGARAGFYGDNTTHTFIGVSGGGTNQATAINPTTKSTVFLPGPDPNLIIPTGPEYECQFMNPQFLTGSGQNAAMGDVSPTDFASPYHLAGVDDTFPFSGAGQTAGSGQERPTDNYSDANGQTHPAEWLQMDVSPVQDNLGGVLYTVTWQTPTSGSDFYLDVIAFDKAVFPNFPPGTSTFSGGKVNWRIYDNVGGFSTNSSIGNNDILVVSDYALGQKFAATTFSGTNGNLNLVPKLYGAESYYTDVDENILPNVYFAGLPINATSPYIFRPVLFPFTGGFPVLNGLGVGSYFDGAIDDGGRVNGNPNLPLVQSQKYSIYRVLSRGRLPQSVLNSYLPAQVTQPAVNDPGNKAFQGIGAATVLDAHRCVVWLSPYTGDLLTDPGSLDTPSQTSINGAPNIPSTVDVLKNFVQGGGRLFLSGQDVGSALTVGGTVANGPGFFLSDVMNATLASSAGGVDTLSATSGTVSVGVPANRIAGDPTYDSDHLYGSYPKVVGGLPGAIGANFFPYADHLQLGSQAQSDGALDQRGDPLGLPSGANLVGALDTITPVNGAQTGLFYGNGGVAMVYHDDPFGLPKAGATAGQLPNGGTGGRTVFAAFGFEGLSSDASSSAVSDPNAPNTVPSVIPDNPRPNMLHNIVDFLRTGSVSGVITQTQGKAGGGQGVPNATVYLIPKTGKAPPTRATFSALSDGTGRFTILGVEPGTYTIAAYKTGFSSAVANSNVVFEVEGDATAQASLTIAPLNPGNITGEVHDTANPANPVVGATVTFLSKDKSLTLPPAVTSSGGPGTTLPPGFYFAPNAPVTDYTGSAVGPNNPNGLPEYLPAATPDPPYNTTVTVLPSTTTGDGSVAGGPPVNFTLTPILATISGRIFNTATGDTAAGALPNATVTLTDATGKVVATTKTLADGTYSFANVPSAQTATTYTITATLAGFATTNNTLSVTVYLGDIITGKDIGLTPIPPGTITGTVNDGATPTPNPIPGATVTAVSADGTVKQTTTTDATGAYTFAGLPPATYTVTAVGPLNPHGRPTSSSTAPQIVVVTSGNTTTVPPFVLTIIPPSFSGIVTDGTNPLPNVTVTVTDDNSGQVIRTIKTGSDGSYKTGPLPVSGSPNPSATYTITASLAGFTTVSLLGTDPDDLGSPKIVVYDGDVFTSPVADIKLMAVPPGSLFGRVVDTSGNPVQGAIVTFVSSDGTVTKTATTDASGNYVIPPTGNAPNVPAGQYSGSAVGPTHGTPPVPEYQPSATQTVTVAPGTTPPAPANPSGPFNFVLTPISPSVTGTVTDSATAKPIPGATVTFTPAGGTALTFTTDSNGTYATGNLAPGAYTVTASAPNYFPSAAATVTVQLGDTLTQSFALDEQATLDGLVTDASTGAALSGVAITISNAAGLAVATIPASVVTTAATTPGPDGQPFNYTAALKPGTYTVTASKGNYTSQTQVVTLVQGFNRLNFTGVKALLSSIGTIGGLVTDSTGTTPVSGATVTVTDASGNVLATIPTTSGSGTGPDGGQINYSGQVPQGTGYTVTVTDGSRPATKQTKITILGGQFNRVDFTGAIGIPPLHTFAAGLNFLSTPYDYSTLGFDAVFGNLNTAATGTPANGNRSHVAVWNPAVGAYALDPNPPADTLRLGVGYWIFLKNPVPLTQQGATPSAATIPVTLHAYWNQIGVPSTTGVPVSSLKFDNGAGGTITFAQAVSSQYHLVSPTLYRFDGVGYQAVTATDTLQPWNAYWIKVFTNATIEIPTNGGTTPTTGTGTGVPGIP